MSKKDEVGQKCKIYNWVVYFSCFASTYVILQQKFVYIVKSTVSMGGDSLRQVITWLTVILFNFLA